ncbi:hypothetical protein FIBSPDRAFT_939298 [Athelia psychrophila]|uniref:Uncharacterized protein n=1 Tax=Athelia psychrophila TaxID=1759441 RepID=A0A165WQM2_9AGAM|nr:hypothetical protein FIBSPDRAFT_939298 [Fibularhizoctonia sp. CBS 109695]
MYSKSFLALAIAATFVSAAEVKWWSTKSSCQGSPSEDYQNLGCGCNDPPGDWEAVQVTGITSGTRVTAHNQNGCTSASQVAQVYGPACINAIESMSHKPSYICRCTLDALTSRGNAADWLNLRLSGTKPAPGCSFCSWNTSGTLFKRDGDWATGVSRGLEWVTSGLRPI